MKCKDCNAEVKIIKTDKGAEIQVDPKSVRVWSQQEGHSDIYEFRVGYVGHNNTCSKHRTYVK